jgi:hypothetical protein
MRRMPSISLRPTHATFLLTWFARLPRGENFLSARASRNQKGVTGWFDIKGGPLARAYHLLEEIDLGPARDSGRGPLLEFNVGSHPGDSTHYVNAKDKLSLSLLQARLIDLKLPIKLERSK